MATPYADYYNKALENYKPQMQNAMAEANAGMADRGLSNSTAAVGNLARVRNEYDSAARQAATQAQQYDVAAANQERATALQWWDAIQNFNLARQQLQPKWKGAQWAATPTWMASYLDNNALSSGIGDGSGDVQRGSQGYRVTDIGGGGDTAQYIQIKNAQANAEAGLALEKARLAESIRQFNETKAMQEAANKKTDSPWAAMASDAMNGIAIDSDPNTPGHQSAILPSKLLNLWKAQYGIDVLAKAQAGDEQALGLIKTLYQKTWEDILSGATVPGAPGSSAGYGHNEGGSANAAQSSNAQSEVQNIYAGKYNSGSDTPWGKALAQGAVNANPLYWMVKEAEWAGKKMGLDKRKFW